MTLARLESYCERLRSEFPGHRLVTRERVDADLPQIRHALYLLDVPLGLLHHVAWRGLEIAFEVWGDDPVPFVLHTIDPASTRVHFPVRERDLEGMITESRMRPGPYDLVTGVLGSLGVAPADSHQTTLVWTPEAQALGRRILASQTAYIPVSWPGQDPDMHRDSQVSESRRRGLAA